MVVKQDVRLYNKIIDIVREVDIENCKPSTYGCESRTNSSCGSILSDILESSFYTLCAGI